MRAMLLGLVCVPVLFGCPNRLYEDDEDTKKGGGDDETTTETVYEPQIDADRLVVDFGAIGVDCRSQVETIKVLNVGNYPLDVTGFELLNNELGVFDMSAKPGLVAPDDFLPVLVDFTPSEVRAYDGVLVRVRSDDSDDWKIDIELVGEGAPDQASEQTFYQSEVGPVDILFALDNSNDMEEMIDDLIGQLPFLVEALDLAGVDYHIGVISTDVTSPTRSGRLIGDPPFVTPSTPSAADALVANARLVTGGPEDFAAFDAVTLALSEPLLSAENAGFLRSDSQLSIVAYSDVDDGSAQTGADFAVWLNGLQSTAEHATFSAVSGPMGGILGCIGFFSGLSVDPAPRYGTAIQDSGGIHMNICNYGALEIVTDTALHATGLQVDFVLEQEVTNPDWISVVVEGKLVDQSSDDGFTYVESSNAIRFHGSAFPLPGAEIVVTYPTATPCP